MLDFAYVNLPHVLCALLLLPTRVIVEANLIWRVGSLAVGVELVGLSLCVVYLLGGAAWLRHFWFAVAFFLIAVPWPSQWEDLITQNLMRINTAIAKLIVLNNHLTTLEVVPRAAVEPLVLMAAPVAPHVA